MTRLDHILFADRATAATIADTYGQQLSYSAFISLTLRYVEVLKDTKIGEGDRVVLLTEKSVDSLAMLFAILKTGAVYVPISTANNADRIQQMIEDVEPALICTQPHCAFDKKDRRQVLNSVIPFALYLPPVSASKRKSSKDTAAILYTSGSSGYPKGVVLSHEAMLTFAAWAFAAIPIQSRSRVASIAGFHFDLSVFDLYTTMMAGASLYLYDDKVIRNPLLLAQLLAQDKITHIYSTPTLLHTLVQYGKLQKQDVGALATVLFAGEVYPIASFKLLKAQLPQARFFNLYGPTETNVCTYYEVPAAMPVEYVESFPIGKPCPYVQYLLLDESGSPINGVNNEGELIIAGDSLFTAYWKDELKTAAAFYTDSSGLKYYRTGDIVYKDTAGLLHYKGRRDRMIKRKGYRIEPAEVERLISIHSAVAQVAVWSTKEGKMCAAVVVHDSSIDEVQMKAWCKMNMPDWMLPDRFIFMQEMPQTPSGKLDLQTIIKNTEL